MGRITPTTGDYSRTCDCKTGYERDNQKVCKPVNLCDKNTDGKPNNKCGAKNDCAYTGPGAYKCTCKSGYSGTETANDKATCAEINACDTNNGGCGKRNGGAGATSSTCTKTGPATRTCACKTGYTSSFEGEKCVEIDMCRPWSQCKNADACSNCKNSNGVRKSDHCSKTGPGTFKCICPADFKQDAANTGCVAVDKCATSNGGCHAQATCATNSKTAKVTCVCKTGYNGNGASCSLKKYKIVVKLKNAKSLADTDGWGKGKSDPYARVKLDGSWCRTPYVSGNHNPVWNKECKGSETKTVAQWRATKLYYELWDDDWGYDNNLGYSNSMPGSWLSATQKSSQTLTSGIKGNGKLYVEQSLTEA